MNSAAWKIRSAIRGADGVFNSTSTTAEASTTGSYRPRNSRIVLAGGSVRIVCFPRAGFLRNSSLLGRSAINRSSLLEKVREAHSLRGSPLLQPAVQRVWYVTKLDHLGHDLSLITCEKRVNQLNRHTSAYRRLARRPGEPLNRSECRRCGRAPRLPAKTGQDLPPYGNVKYIFHLRVASVSGIWYNPLATR